MMTADGHADGMHHADPPMARIHITCCMRPLSSPRSATTGPPPRAALVAVGCVCLPYVAYVLDQDRRGPARATPAPARFNDDEIMPCATMLQF